MLYPLAHDEEGIPLDVPATATGWLVRRHGGGRGRPGAVYNGDGRPLVVALDATVSELRNVGCKPGPYRLDAVDGNRRPLGMAAYTEVVADGEAAEAEGKPANGDPAVMALARAVEAMQRVQAERERVQAEMFGKLIERLTPPPPQPAVDLRNAVTQVLDLQKLLRESMAVEEGEEEGAAPAAAGQPWWATPAIGQIMNGFFAALTQWVAGGGKKVPVATAPRNAVQPEVPVNGTATHAEPAINVDAPVMEPSGDAELDTKMSAVLAKLEPGERAEVVGALPLIPPHVREQVHTLIKSMTVDEAVATLREYLVKVRGPVARS